MNASSISPSACRGSFLIESVIAMGVLAIAIPLVFGALAESAKSGMAAGAETRGGWMVTACLEEIQASRDGRSSWFPPSRQGEIFPPAGEVWALAFSPEGKVIGGMEKAAYESGTRQLHGRTVRYIASIRSGPATAVSPMLAARIDVEYPAAAPLARREKLHFHTRVP